jgi:hypothetical protein
MNAWNSGDERGPWYLLTGLVLGILIGLAYAWTVQPVRYTDTTPSSLRQDFKDQYRALIAAAFLGNGDVVRARARLELLKDEDMYRALTEQAQRTLAENGSDSQARALGLLAIALGKEPPGPGGAVTQAERGPTAGPTQPRPTSPVFDTAAPRETAEAPPTAEPTDTPLPPTESLPGPTDTAEAALPTATNTEAPAAALQTEAPAPTSSLTPAADPPTATPDGPFVLLSQEKVCDKPLGAPLFQIEALDRFNQPLAGALVIVTWTGGQERFFTGLKPEMGPGYADFRPSEGILYTVRLGENGVPVAGLAAVMCSQGGGAPVWGAWSLKFVQP